MNLSTIIVAWNCEDFIDDCLESLYLNGPVEHQVIVVDNHSTDRTLEIVKQYGEVELIANPKNMGLGYATWQGEQLAKHDLIMAANPDLIFTALPELLQFAEEHPEKDIMMPCYETSEKGVYGKPEKAVHWHRYPHYLSFSIGVKLNSMFGDFLKKYCTQYKYENSIQVDDDKHVYGASCMLFRRSLVEKLGGIYRPNYFWAWADADLGMRFKKYGSSGCGVPTAMMKHHGGYASQKLSDDMKIYLGYNGQKNWEKDWGHSTRYFAAQFVDTIFSTAYHSVKSRRPHVPRSKLMCLKGWLA